MAGTGYFYTTTKNPTATRKLFLRKYDPKLGTHTLFKVPSLCFVLARMGSLLFKTLTRPY